MAAIDRNFVPRPAGAVPQGMQLNWDAEPPTAFY